MDEMTQHNAALVEETNAAIDQTEAQASELDKIVDQFVIDQADMDVSFDEQVADRAMLAAQPKSAPKNVANAYLSDGAAAVQQDPDWQEF
jgi:methyl-accepting chemotaxis protein